MFKGENSLEGWFLMQERFIYGIQNFLSNRFLEVVKNLSFMFFFLNLEMIWELFRVFRVEGKEFEWGIQDGEMVGFFWGQDGGLYLVEWGMLDIGVFLGWLCSRIFLKFQV